jgi:fructose-bisphosphate aldolase class II
MLVHTLDLLHAAMRSTPRYGVLAFNVIGLEHAEAIIEGAEAEASPVILQISQNAIRYRNGAIEPIAAACREMAKNARVPVALHLDHATTHDLCMRAQACGFNSFMFDASALPWEENLALTTSEADWAHEQDLSLEGELGIVGGKDGAVTSLEGMTDPDAAAAYVAATGVDALAVAVGTEHGMTEQVASLDLDRIAALHAAVDIPLVLHGSSGVPADMLREAVRRGITKVNVATQLNAAFTGAIRTYLEEHADVTDPRAYGQVGRAAIVDVVRAYMQMVGSSGRAHPNAGVAR